MNCEENKIRMMKKVDGRISADEEAALRAHVEGCEECRAELADFVEQKAATDLIRERLQYDAALDDYWKGVHNRLERGVGLGLFMVYGMVKNHKGTVKAESREGEGTRFVLTFPRP